MGIKELFDVLEEARIGQNKQTQTKTTKKPQPTNPQQHTKKSPFPLAKKKSWVDSTQMLTVD